MYENAKHVQKMENSEEADRLLYMTNDYDNYCIKNKEFPGTVGRECINDDDSKGSCKELCCGRGIETITKNIKVTVKETCKFHWNDLMSKPWMDCKQQNKNHQIHKCK